MKFVFLTHQRSRSCLLWRLEFISGSWWCVKPIYNKKNFRLLAAHPHPVPGCSFFWMRPLWKTLSIIVWPRVVRKSASKSIWIWLMVIVLPHLWPLHQRDPSPLGYRTKILNVFHDLGQQVVSRTQFWFRNSFIVIYRF